MSKVFKKRKINSISINRKSKIYFILFILNILILFFFSFLFPQISYSLIIFSSILWSAAFLYKILEKDIFIYFSIWIFWISLFIFENEFIDLNLISSGAIYWNLNEFSIVPFSFFQLIIGTYSLYLIFIYLKRLNKSGKFFINIDSKFFPFIALLFSLAFSIFFLWIYKIINLIYVDEFYNFSVLYLITFLPFMIFIFSTYFLKNQKDLLVTATIFIVSIFLVFLTKNSFLISLPIFFISSLILPFIFVNILFILLLYLNLNIIGIFLIVNFLIIVIYIFKFNFKFSFINEKEKEEKVNILNFIGGMENIIESSFCMTRIRLIVKSTNKINEDKLKEIGAFGIIIDNNYVQIIFGLNSEKIYKDNFKN